MRAIVFDQPGDESVLRVATVEPPVMAPHALRIRVQATAVNRADLLQRQGLYPPPPGVSPLLGLECAGEVVEVGREVTGWQVGARAMALLSGGGYAEQVVVDAGAVMPVPSAISDEEAGAIPETFITAFLNIFLLGKPPDKGRVLVHGGGSGVGTAATSLCKEAGLTVLVTAGSDEKCARCLQHGADVAINYHTEEFAPRVLAATQGKGVDVILDCVGGRYLGANVKCLTMGGALIVIGLTGGTRGELDLATLLRRRLRLEGSTLRARSAVEKAAIVNSFIERFGEALKSGRVRPVVDRILPLAQAAEGHRVLKASEHFGKVVLRVN
nr:NAD(P)H-quinone oxidoreductase [Gammaproteobacteria bacterium]